MKNAERTTRIKSQATLQGLNLAELYQYRDLFRFMVLKNVKVMYTQSILGIGWAIIQPLFQMLVFTIVFGNITGVGAVGLPYPIFSLAGLVPWTFFSSSTIDAGNSLVQNAQMLSKVYFPREILPLSSVIAKLLDFFIAFSMLVVLMLCFGLSPINIILITPLMVVLMTATSFAAALWLSALSVQYRDVKHAMFFLMQIGLYISPVIYSSTRIPQEFRLFYGLNPMVGVIEGFRCCISGAGPMPWDLISVGTVSCAVLLYSGFLNFKRLERRFADVA